MSSLRATPRSNAHNRDSASDDELELSNASFVSALGAAPVAAGMTTMAAAMVHEEEEAAQEQQQWARRVQQQPQQSRTATPRSQAGSSHHSTAPSAAASEAPAATTTTDAAEDLPDADFMSIAMKFFYTGYPLTASTLAQFSLNTLILSVVGRMLSVEEMGGTSLALGLINATGFAFGAGLCGALETVLSHTYGLYERRMEKVRDSAVARGADPDARDAEEAAAEAEARRGLLMYGTYTQRMSVILLAVALPLGFILCYADVLLEAVGESDSVVYFTGTWCRTAVFGIPAALAYQLLQRYYSCQQITKPLSVAMLSAAVINPFLQIIFIKMFGFVGSPIAWLLLMTGIVLGLTLYLKLTRRHRTTWGGWNERSLQHLGSLTALALPSMGVMLSEWVALEVNALASGFAPPKELAAFSITLIIFGIMWGIPSGIMILVCVYVGNAIGAGRPLLARRIAFIAIAIVFSLSVVDSLVAFALSPWLPYLFTKDHEVAARYRSLMYVVYVYHVFDTFQSTMMSIFRGCEMQRLGALIICTVFCVVGVPFSFLLFFYFDIGVQALWIGPASAVAFVGAPTYVYILFRRIDWENLKPHSEESQGPAVAADSDSRNSNEATDVTIVSSSSPTTAA